MAKPKRKPQQRRTPNVGDAVIRLPRPLKLPPTEIELVAKAIKSLSDDIQMRRRRIGHIQQDLDNERRDLNQAVLEHAEQTKKLAALAVLPQP